MLGLPLEWDQIVSQMAGFSSVPAIVFAVTLVVGVNLVVFLVNRIYVLFDRD